MDEEKYELAMRIITHAGTGKSCALEAIDLAADGDFAGAEQSLAEARGEMREAHDIQFSMIQQEASGRPVDVHLILLHAEDHLTMAIMCIDLAERFMALYRRIAHDKQGG